MCVALCKQNKFDYLLFNPTDYMTTKPDLALKKNIKNLLISVGNFFSFFPFLGFFPSFFALRSTFLIYSFLLLA